jgi:hypothetical protein
MQCVDCRVEDTVWIGPHICLLILGRLYSRMCVCLEAPPSVVFEYAGELLRRAVLADGNVMYLFSLDHAEGFCVDGTEVLLCRYLDRREIEANGGQDIQVEVRAPASRLQVRCEQPGQRMLLESLRNVRKTRARDDRNAHASSDPGASRHA